MDPPAPYPDEPPGPPETLTRKAYKVGGSVAVRLPKDMAEEFGIQPGTPVQFRRTRTGVLVEPATPAPPRP